MKTRFTLPLAILVLAAAPMTRAELPLSEVFNSHWNHNGESQFLSGTAMGQRMAELWGP